ncbi:CD226 antigen isoform X2 [Trichomycterus rosablanca]|uniref:CD226 antigen isoform X2 n=1 Tax=Trichomycterus rosablanca TaxID=2290929 RepID=UPI002F35FA1E
MVVMMEPVQKQNWYFMVLLVSLTSLKVSDQLKAGGHRVVLKDGMVLTCTCPWNGTLTMLSWTKEGESSPLAIYHPDFGVSFSTEYDGRVSFLRGSKLDGSISITNISGRDEGRYHCSIQTFPKGPWSKFIHVEKRVSFPSVSPSTDLIVPENSSLTIVCRNVRGGLVYEVTLERLESTDGGHSSLVAVCRLTEGVVKLEQVSHAGSVNCSEEMEMELQLEDGGGDDRGIYRCNFSTDIGVYSTIIHPTTPHSQGFESYQYSQYMYIGAGGAAALVLMGVVFFYVWINRRRERRLEYSINSHAAKRQSRRTKL